MPQAASANRRPPYTGAAALLLTLLCGTCLPAVPELRAQGQPATAAPDLSLPAVRWAEEAAANEERVVNYDESAPLRYRVRRIDAKGETVRETIESKEGSIARLIERNGQPLTVEENAAERDRLQAILDSPDAVQHRMRREAGSRSYAIELLRNMAKAMQWSYVPGQPQLPDAATPAVVLDFKPDRNFKPPSLITEGLTGIAGRVWIDAASHCVTRIQGSILHPVDFGWGGVLARIKEGGSIELEQRKANDRRWLYSHLVEHITIREVLVHTTVENAQADVIAVQSLPSPVSLGEAVRTLLAIPVATR